MHEAIVFLLSIVSSNTESSNDISGLRTLRAKIVHLEARGDGLRISLLRATMNRHYVDGTWASCEGGRHGPCRSPHSRSGYRRHVPTFRCSSESRYVPTDKRVWADLLRCRSPMSRSSCLLNSPKRSLPRRPSKSRHVPVRKRTLSSSSPRLACCWRDQPHQREPRSSRSTPGEVATPCAGRESSRLGASCTWLSDPQLARLR